MRADFGAFFDDDNAGFRCDLLEPNGSGKPGRPGAYDDDVEVHAFSLGQSLGGRICDVRHHGILRLIMRRLGMIDRYVEPF